MSAPAKPLFSTPPESLCMHKYAIHQRTRRNSVVDYSSHLPSRNQKFHPERYEACVFCGKDRTKP